VGVVYGSLTAAVCWLSLYQRPSKAGQGVGTDICWGGIGLCI